MATITITPGNSFTATETVTSTKLNNLGSPTAALTAASIGTADIADDAVTAAKLATDALELAYPVGSVYMNASVATNPATLLGFGTWATFGAGKVPVGIDTTDDDFDVVGSGTNTNLTTGAKTHTLGVTEIPPHKHQVQIEQAAASVDFGTGTGVRPPLAARDTDQGNVGENSDGTGNASPHNNLQPYIVVYMWTRTI
jgi:hypothetical protein